MALQLVADQTTGFASVTGVTSAGAGLRLGRNATSTSVGAHFLGFDTAYGSLVLVNAAYDPALEPTGSDARRALATCSFAGYVQLLRLSFLGQPIPPSLFAGALAERMPYAALQDFGDRYEFVDFMGPAQVNARRTPSQAFHPFFALNAMLFEDIGSLDGLAGFPHRNGSLLRAAQRGPHDAQAATLSDSVSISELTEDVVARWAGAAKVIASAPVTARQLATTNVALLALQTIAATTTLPARERALAAEDITRARQIGRYTLLSVANLENEEPVLCVHVEGSGGAARLEVRLFTYDVVEDAEEDATTALFARIADFFAEQNIRLPAQTEPPPRFGKGRSGLDADPFPSLSGPCLELRGRTVAFGMPLRSVRSHVHGIVPLSGVQWSLVWSFSRDQHRFELADIPRPTAVPYPDSLVFSGALNRYYETIDKPEYAGAEIDTTSFAQAELDTVAFGENAKKRKFVSSGDTDV